jgi:Zn finger protein HypA/HybF involved in hydrogenase expression
MINLLAAHRHAANNRAEIEASGTCGCFCCVQLFPPAEIVAWTGLDAADFDNPEALDRGTALCPRCGSESVIGDRSGYAIDVPFLSRMNEAWHQKTIIRPPLAKK